MRAGADVTVVATQLMRHRALEAAEALAGEGICVEVIDPRTLVPFDLETMGASVDGPTASSSSQEARPAAAGARR